MTIDQSGVLTTEKTTESCQLSWPIRLAPLKRIQPDSTYWPGPCSLSVFKFRMGLNTWLLQICNRLLVIYYDVSDYLLKRIFSSALDVFCSRELCGVCKWHRESTYTIITFFKPHRCFASKCARLRPNWLSSSPAWIGIIFEANTS